MMPDSVSILFHPWAARRHKENAPRHSHFEGDSKELAELVASAFASGNVLPGKFPDTYVIPVEEATAAVRFRAPGERHMSGVSKPQAKMAKVIVWSAKALAKDSDPMASKCKYAIVGIRAAA